MFFFQSQPRTRMPPKKAATKTNKGTEKAAENSKKAKEDKKAAHAALATKCSVCSLLMANPANYKQHWEGKHAKLPLPAELQ